MEFATNARAIGGLVRWMTRDTDSQQTDRPARVPLSGAQAAALLRIGGEPMHEAERADSGTNGVIVGAAAHGAPAHQAPASRAAGRITLAVLGLMGFSVLVQVNSEQVPPNAPQSSGLVGRAPDTGASHIHDTLQGHHKMLNKITGVTAAAVVGIAATVAGAQSAAVQWKVEDGGNGHWYQMVAPGTIGWYEARSLALGMGGDLASITSLGESEFVLVVTSDLSGWSPDGQYLIGPWLGGYQDHSAPDYHEPAGGWRWASGEPWLFTRWLAPEPNNGWGGGEDFLHLLTQPPTIGISPNWNDANFPNDLIKSLVVEWSADCNNDGIADYGQCQDGTLADYNSNNIPDCCERGEACVVGNYPMQWRIEEGGNGHWYQRVGQDVPGQSVCWQDASDQCRTVGGELVSLNNQEEEVFLLGLCPAFTGWIGYQGTNYWSSGELVTFTHWGPAQPSGDGPYATASCPDGWWNDIGGSGGCWNGLASYTVEWSADCNSDGIVDYGQILTGQLADSNTNGIPDICEQPQCQDADITNNQIIDGADLGAMLAFWGPVNPVLPQADINHDGEVNGADLSLLLSFWGPCP